MTESDTESLDAEPQAPHFQTTHWSAVLAARGGDADPTRKALAHLCEAYWYPLYVFIRRQGHSAEDAQDLAQGFFARALEKNYFQEAEPAKGKFRSFLLLALKRYMANEWHRANRQKRGGGRELISLDAHETETRYRAEPVDGMSPEKAYDVHWAQALLQRALERLGVEYAAGGRRAVFDALRSLLGGEQLGKSYAEVGHELGMSEGAVKVAVHRLRQHYRELLRDEIARTVASPEMVDEELRELFRVFE